MKAYKVVRKENNQFLSLCPSCFDLEYALGKKTSGITGPIFCYDSKEYALTHCRDLRAYAKDNQFFVFEVRAEIDQCVIDKEEQFCMMYASWLTVDMLRSYWYDEKERAELLHGPYFKDTPLTRPHTLFGKKHHTLLCSSVIPKKIIL